MKRSRHISAKTQHRRNAAKQRAWATEADRDAKNNDKSAKNYRKRGMFVEAANSSRESKVDRMWAKKRRGWAKTEEKKGR